MTLSRKLFDSMKDWLPDPVYLGIYHKHRMGRFPNIKHPTTFNEKILRRCLYPDPRYIDLSDKLKVRQYVAEKVGKQFLVPIIDQPPDLNRRVFATLPKSFVMKANHGSGFVKVVWDKSETTYEELAALAQEWLAINFYTVARERHYRTIIRRLFFEELLVGDDGNVPSDLKFHVFNKENGEQTIYIAVITDRFGEHPRGDMYDANWNIQDIGIGNYERSTVPAPRPKHFDTLLWVARELAKEFEYVRVDLYETSNAVYFGEMTFTPGAGLFPMFPDQVDYEWGRLF